MELRPTEDDECDELLGTDATLTEEELEDKELLTGDEIFEVLVEVEETRVLDREDDSGEATRR